MKQALLLCTLLIIGCTSKRAIEPVEMEMARVDSVIAHSQQVVKEAHLANHRADSAVKEDVAKVVKIMRVLNLQMEQMKTVQKVEKIRIDTVYIETKKNFWGKEKTKTTIISDTIVLVDSIEN